MEAENLIGVYLKLLSVLECPVCLDYLTKPVAMCHEGHALCSKCKSNVSSCPMCRNPISTTRGLILDQIIETLLYPCYKMGCGSLLKRRDAENHDLNCTMENTTDKQAVLHNNLLKNIEENFGSFLVQPEIVKETRTVGTVTGRVKTADARVQTAAPFSSSLILEKLNSSSADCSSGLRSLPVAGPTSGISISSIDPSPNSIFNMAFALPPTSSLDHNSLAFSMNPDGFNNTNMSSMYSTPQDSNFKFSLESFQNINCFPNDNAVQDPYSKPFTFTYGIENNSGIGPKNGSKKPSTNLSVTMESGPSSREIGAGASNDFFIRNQDIPLANLSLSSSLSSPGQPALKLSRNDFNSENKTPKNKPSTNLVSCSTLVNNLSSNSSQSLVPNNSLMTSSQRKRPTTNLCGLTSQA